MTFESPLTNPFNDEQDHFAELIGEIAFQIEDPYLVDLHRRALASERLVAESRDESSMALRAAEINKLDAAWRYMGQSVGVTGDAWINDPRTPEMKKDTLIDQPAVSHGFVFNSDTSEDSSDPSYRVCHLVSYACDDDDMVRIQAVLPLIDEPHIRLPYPSPELRLRRFAYYFPEDAKFIDELAFLARREDQVIYDLREFSFDANLGDPDEIEYVRDANEYVRQRAGIDPRINYAISIYGDMILLDNDETGMPVSRSKPYTQLVKINDIVLRPADITVQELRDTHRIVPFLDITSFEPNGTNRNILVPCTSLLWINSGRYLQPTAPDF